MAGELLAQIRPSDFYRETSVGYNTTFATKIIGTSNGQSQGLSFQKFISANLKEYYNAWYVVPAAVAIGTGLTFRFMWCDDGNNAADLGLAFVIEVTPFNLSASGALADWSVSGSKGTATTTTVTLSATAQNPVLSSTAIVAANLASLAAGNILGVRLRRIGDNASDTVPGRVICLGGIVTNT